jgi:hypothetical protein
VIVASAVLERIFVTPVLLVGVALLVCNGKVARAMLVAERAGVDTLEIQWLKRLLAKRQRSAWYRPFVRLIGILVGVALMGFAVAVLVLG